MTGSCLHPLFRLLILACLLAARESSPAAPLQATLPDGTLVNADYQAGNAQAPAVLIIHGFLQTQNFPTVRRLADALHEDMGYSVLTPTLSLGISDRRQSLACEAIQRHSMQSAVREILFWTDWLIRHGHRNIVLLGHSMGSLMILASLSRAPGEVKQAVLISPTYIGQHLDVFERRQHDEDLRKARRLLEREPTKIDTYHIAYCRAYTALPGDILEYYAWDRARTLAAMRSSRVPLTVILGSADRRIDDAWEADIAATGTEIVTIEGANHFFDEAHEFDLLDAVDQAISRRSP